MGMSEVVDGFKDFGGDLIDGIVPSNSGQWIADSIKVAGGYVLGKKHATHLVKETGKIPEMLDFRVKSLKEKTDSERINVSTLINSVEKDLTEF